MIKVSARREADHYDRDVLFRLFQVPQDLDTTTLLREVVLIYFYPRFLQKTKRELGAEGAVYDFLKRHQHFMKCRFTHDPEFWKAVMRLSKEQAQELVHLANGNVLRRS